MTFRQKTLTVVNNASATADASTFTFVWPDTLPSEGLFLIDGSFQLASDASAAILNVGEAYELRLSGAVSGGLTQDVSATTEKWNLGSDIVLGWFPLVKSAQNIAAAGSCFQPAPAVCCSGFTQSVWTIYLQAVIPTGTNKLVLNGFSGILRIRSLPETNGFVLPTYRPKSGVRRFQFRSRDAIDASSAAYPGGFSFNIKTPVIGTYRMTAQGVLTRTSFPTTDNKPTVFLCQGIQSTGNSFYYGGLTAIVPPNQATANGLVSQNTLCLGIPMQARGPAPNTGGAGAGGRMYNINLFDNVFGNGSGLGTGQIQDPMIYDVARVEEVLTFYLYNVFNGNSQSINWMAFSLTFYPV